jgi:rhodanese-related sulfurtransferase
LPEKNRFESIDGDELYRRLAVGEPLVVLDVRTASEFEERHIPGSVLVPLQSLESELETVPNSGIPIAVVCEEGHRCVSACRLLAEHGFGPLLRLDGGLARWSGPLTTGLESNGPHKHGLAPSSFLVENFKLLRRGLALDLAMGEGRNAIYLATRGFDVDGVDSRPEAVARARVAARKLGAPIRALVANLEDGSYTIRPETYDLIVVFNYLHRPLLPAIKEGVVPGGIVVYQSYTAEQARLGKPRDPAYLLEAAELRRVFADWEILRYREFVGPSRRGGRERAIAGIVARRSD